MRQASSVTSHQGDALIDKPQLLFVTSPVLGTLIVCVCVQWWWWWNISCNEWHRQQLIVLFCSLAVLDPSISHTTDVLSAFISALCNTDRLFYEESCPSIDVVHSGCAWSSSPACTWHCSLHCQQLVVNA